MQSSYIHSGKESQLWSWRALLWWSRSLVHLGLGDVVPLASCSGLMTFVAATANMAAIQQQSFQTSDWLLLSTLVQKVFGWVQLDPWRGKLTCSTCTPTQQGGDQVSGWMVHKVLVTKVQGALRKGWTRTLDLVLGL